MQGETTKSGNIVNIYLALSVFKETKLWSTLVLKQKKAKILYPFKLKDLLFGQHF